MLPEACEGYFTCNSPRWCIHPPPTPHLIPPTLSTPLAPTIPFSPQRPTPNRLRCNLFKYFDISPPLTSRAEMICDSWRWARLEELPLTPCPPYLPPSFFVEGQIFPLSNPIFICLSLFTTAPPVSWGRPWKASLLHFFFLLSQCVRQTGWYSSICWHVCVCCLSCAFCSLTTYCLVQADTV